MTTKTKKRHKALGFDTPFYEEDWQLDIGHCQDRSDIECEALLQEIAELEFELEEERERIVCFVRTGDRLKGDSHV